MKRLNKLSINIPIFSFILLTIISCQHGPSGTKTSLADSAKINQDTVRYLYVGTYTKTDPSAAENSIGIYVLKLNLKSGALRRISVSPATSNPSFLVLHPNLKYLYAVNEDGGKGPTDFGKVSAFQIDPGTHQVRLLNSVSSKGKDPCHISIDPLSNCVMVANYSSGNVCLIPLNTDGSLKEASSVLQDEGKGPNTARQEGPHAHMISPDPSGKFVYETDLGTDKLMCFTLDVEKKELVKTANTTSLTPGAGPRHFVFHHQHPWVYIVNELNGTIEAFNEDNSSGRLSRFQIISTLPEGVKIPADCAEIFISPSGKYLYASNRGENNSIAMYSINDSTGVLSLIGHQSVKGKIPRSFAIDPSGTFLLVANQESNNIVTFRIDPATGKLIDANQEINIPMPVCILFEQKAQN
jgi:6-phosphogluconolactonase